jgi:hypothetical protein
MPQSKSRKDTLWLHRELQRLVFTLGTDAEEKLTDESENINPLIMVKLILPHAEVFDCRSLPDGFLIDTGQSFAEEPAEIRGPIRLPFQHCYYEFSDQLAVLASTSEFVEQELDNGSVVRVPTFAFPIRLTILNGRESNEGWSWLSAASFLNMADEPLISELDASGPDTLNAIHMVLGTLNLLREKLVYKEFNPDPKPWVSRARKAKGKYPISSASHVLKVNVAAIHKAVRGSELKPHESPALHWRRGHHRVLHRGSEFESRTWVRRCLVGDPAKGFIRKQYRIVNETPLINTTLVAELFEQ